MNAVTASTKSVLPVQPDAASASNNHATQKQNSVSSIKTSHGVKTESNENKKKHARDNTDSGRDSENEEEIVEEGRGEEQAKKPVKKEKKTQR